MVTEVLGPAGKPGVDTLSIIRGFNLPDKFPEDALENARCQAEDVTNHRQDGTPRGIRVLPLPQCEAQAWHGEDVEKAAVLPTLNTLLRVSF